MSRCHSFAAGDGSRLRRKMRVVPPRSSAAYVFEIAGGPRTRFGYSRCGRTIRCCPAEHARFVLHKGDDPPADTFLPAHQLVGRLPARIVPERTAAIVSGEVSHLRTASAYRTRGP